MVSPTVNHFECTVKPASKYSSTSIIIHFWFEHVLYYKLETFQIVGGNLNPKQTLDGENMTQSHINPSNTWQIVL